MANNKMTTCKACGAPIAKSAKVCPQCGAKHKKKHPILGIIVVLIGLSIFGSALSNGTSKKNTDEKQMTVESSSAVEKDTETVAETTLPPETTAPSPLIEEKVIYQGNDVVITVKSLEKNTLTFLIENNSLLNLKFNMHSYAVNGIMTQNNIYSMSTETPAGKKATAKLEIKRSFLKEHGIDEIKNFSFLFWAYDNDKSFKAFDTGIITLSTSLDDGVQVTDFGKQILKEDGFEYGFVSFEKNKLRFYVTNNTDGYFAVSAEDVSVNDFGFDPFIQFYDKELHPHTTIIGELKFDNEFLNDNGIQEIKKVEFSIARGADGSLSLFENPKSSIIHIDIE